MTRILYWNIEMFDLLKIDNPDMVGLLAPFNISHSVASGNRSTFILNNLHATAPGDDPKEFPDIIVVIEVNVGMGGYTATGNLAIGDAGAGVRLLLDNIRAVTDNQAWMLVPPLMTGRCEAVAIYYDSSRYCFTGPWLWPGGNIGPSRAPGGAPIENPAYDGYDGCLPDRLIPAGLPNAGINESRVASRVTGYTYYQTVGGDAAGAPVVFDGPQRAPCLATLAEVNFGVEPPQVRRTFSLFAIHSPVRPNRARAFLGKLGNVEEVVRPAVLAANDIRLVLGDFNFNLTDKHLVQDQAYTDFAAKGFQLGIVQPPSPPAPPIPVPPTGYRGFFATHMRTLAEATYWRMNSNADCYPGYGYTDPESFCLDNIFARFGPVQGSVDPCGTLTHITMLNSVVGAPYNDHAPPGNVPIGYFGYGMQMASVNQYQTPPLVIPVPAQPPPPVAPDPRRASFAQWDNYGCIRSTSDHVPILFDV